MISQERFDQIEIEHGCGYWNICWEHACPCAIVTENKGLQESIYNSLIRESQEISERFEDDDFDWEYEEDEEVDCFDEDEECCMEFESVKSDYEINMKYLGYGFFSNYSKDCDLLKRRVEHLKKNGIDFKIGIAYDRLGRKLSDDNVSLYIKNWNIPGNDKLVKLVNEMQL